MATLADINETLKQQNETLVTVSETLVDQIKSEKRNRLDDLEEKREATVKKVKEKSKLDSPRSFSEGFSQGLGFGIPGGAGLASAMGLAAGAAGAVAGKTLKFGIPIALMQTFGEQAFQSMFDAIDPNNIMISDKDKETLSTELTDAGSVALGARFLGFGWPAAIGGAVGTLFGSRITELLTNIFGDEVNNPFSEWIGPEDIDLTNPLIGEALGGLAGILVVGLLGAVRRKLLLAGAGFFTTALSGLGLNQLRNLGQRNLTPDPSRTTSRFNTKGETPRVTRFRPFGMFTGPDIPEAPKTGTAPNMKVDPSILRRIQQMETPELNRLGLDRIGTGAIVDRQSRRFASVDDVIARMDDQALNRISKAVKLLKVLGVIAGAAEVAMIAKLYYDGAPDSVIKRELAGLIGSTGVGVVGATLGAAGGSMVLPGWGTVGGGVLGGLAGAIGGEMAAEAMADMIMGKERSSVQITPEQADILRGAGIDSSTVSPQMSDPMFGYYLQGSQLSAATSTAAPITGTGSSIAPILSEPNLSRGSAPVIIDSFNTNNVDQSTSNTGVKVDTSPTLNPMYGYHMMGEAYGQGY